MYKDISIVMLPTEKAPNSSDRIWFNKYEDNYKLIYGVVHPTGNYNPQHLYFLSDDEIKEDWIYDSNFNKITKHKGESITYLKNYCKKIISSTDESLKISKPFNSNWGGLGHSLVSLPRPSKEFLKKFCELGGIDKCLVEYVYFTNHKDYKLVYSDYKLKVAPDNTITILNF